MSKAKSIAKSIRLTEEVFAYIDGYQGNGFNEKFENIILDAMLSESQRLERLQNLDDRITSKRKELQELDKLMADTTSLRRTAMHLEREMDGFLQNVSQMRVAAPDSEE